MKRDKQPSNPPFILLAGGSRTFLQRGDACLVKHAHELIDLEIPGRERKSGAIVSLWFRQLKLSSAWSFQTTDFRETKLKGGFWFGKNHALLHVQLTLTESDGEWSAIIEAQLAEELSGFDSDVSVVVNTRCRIADHLEFIWQ